MVERKIECSLENVKIKLAHILAIKYLGNLQPISASLSACVLNCIVLYKISVKPLLKLVFIHLLMMLTCHNPFDLKFSVKDF